MIAYRLDVKNYEYSKRNKTSFKGITCRIEVTHGREVCRARGARASLPPVFEANVKFSILTIGAPQIY